ncbi:MAG: clan AA aspartic protease [Candidatus Riflebacteria bacterium]|nr:clan AA aspartic protease [Candidatus Riflebacteria bacterium]
MGLVYADIELVNAVDEGLRRRGKLREAEVRRLTARALVDSGAGLLVIPENVAVQLDLVEVDQREIRTADGRSLRAPICGPVEIRFANRLAIGNAAVLGNQVLLGAIPLEELDVLIDPRNEKLIVNPEAPNMASVKVV